MSTETKRSKGGLAPLIFLVIMGVLLYRFGEHWLRLILLYLSGAGWARRTVTDFPLAWRVASRFVAGETVEDAIIATRRLNEKGMTVTLDLLGESVNDRNEAIFARNQIITMLDRIHTSRIDANVSLKLSQLGLNIDPELALDNMRQILTKARETENRVRIDMEDSPVIDLTFDIYHTLRDEDGFDNVGIVVQSYLYRTDADVAQLVDEGAWVRLVKGAYLEPPEVAFPDKADTDAAFVSQTQALLSAEARANGVYVGVATHDEAMIQATIDYATRAQIPADAYEFQMLYGVRRDLQESLMRDGYRMRVYVPYGSAWYPYFMRRLAERPANLWFFVSNLLRG